MLAFRIAVISGDLSRSIDTRGDSDMVPRPGDGAVGYKPRQLRDLLH